MGFRELVKKVQVYSGFSDQESEDALEHMVESLALRLTEGERKDFASQLPEQLQDIAFAVYPSDDFRKKDIVDDFVENQGVDESRAKKQIMAAWKALKDALTPGVIEHIRAQLPNRIVAQLH